jgi:hypothetical protein
MRNTIIHTKPTKIKSRLNRSVRRFNIYAVNNMINKITAIFAYEAFDVRIVVGIAVRALLTSPKID